MTAQQPDGRVSGQETTGTILKRRGILAAAGAAVAGIIAKQAIQPVAAISGTGPDGNLVLGSNDINNTANYANLRTQLVSGIGNPTGTGFHGAVLFECNASPFQSDGDTNVIGISGASRGTAAGVFGADTTIRPSGYPQGMNAGVYGFTYAQGHSGVHGDGGSYGAGVSGESNNSNAILGTTLGSPANANPAILGLGYTYGVEGNVPAGQPVMNSVAVKGINQSTVAGSIGVGGEVASTSTANNTYAVQGFNKSSGAGGYGVQGLSTHSHGVYGEAGVDQGSGALVGVARTVGTVGFQALAISPATYAGFFTGNVSINGSLGVSGSKFAVVKGADNQYRGMYAVESPECWFEDVGTGTLTSGTAEIKLDPLFAQHVHTDSYHVFITEHGDYHVHIAHRDEKGFTAQVTTGAGDATKGAAQVDGTFSWRVMAKRSDITGERMPVWAMPAAPHIPDPPKVEPIKKP